MSDQISHTGIVESNTNGMVRVRITQRSACSSCKIASQCTSSESKEKMIDVRCNNTAKYAIGQEVTVMAATSVGMKAVGIAFVVPIILMITTIAVCLNITNNELTAALAGMIILIPYFIIIYFMRAKLDKMLTFYIKE